MLYSSWYIAHDSMRISFKLLNIAVHGRVYMARKSKCMEPFTFDLVDILRYNVIGVIYVYIYEKVFDMDLCKK